MASGDHRSASRKPKPKGGGRAEKLSQKEQSERFKEAARILEIDKSGREFEAAFGKAVPTKRRGTP